MANVAGQGFKPWMANMDYNPMLAIHGLNPRPALAYDLFLVSDNRVLSIFHLRLPAVLCVRFHAPVVIKR